MILVAGKNKGKRLFRMIYNELKKTGEVELAAISPSGVLRLIIASAGLGEPFPNASAEAYMREIELAEGNYRKALVVKLTVK